MKLCNSNPWTNTLTFIYIENIIKTSFICYFIVTSKNLIQQMVIWFSCSWWLIAEEYLFAVLHIAVQFEEQD